MSTRINWVNPNVAFTEIRIYRTAAPFDDSTIPATPIVTLTEGTTWLDTTTLQNVYYYYTIAVVVNGDVILAPAKKTIHMPYTGPGPQEILVGDISRGYFGIVPSSEMHTNAEICSLVGVVQPGLSAQWAKFIRNGKILFINLYVVSTYTTWNLLYAAGAVYGMDSVGPATGHGMTPVNQRKVITKGEHSFLVRLMRANDTADWSATPAEWGKGEYTTLMHAVFNGYAYAGSETLADFVKAVYFNAQQTTLAEFSGLNSTHLTPSGDLVGTPSANNPRTTVGNWRPVLELVL